MIDNHSKTFLDEVSWTSDGLVPVIAQDHLTQEVLMVAWMNREALGLTVKEQRAIYWSRSRQRLWRKGEESGNVQRVKDIRLDCDSDVIKLSVEQIGDVACHTGRRSCFYKQLDNNEQWQTVEEVLKDPKAMYSSS